MLDQPMFLVLLRVFFQMKDIKVCDATVAHIKIETDKQFLTRLFQFVNVDNSDRNYCSTNGNPSEKEEDDDEESKAAYTTSIVTLCVFLAAACTVVF